MEEGLSPQFQSFQGLRKIIIEKSTMFDEMKNLFLWAKATGLLADSSGQPVMRFLDTFFANFPFSVFDLIVQNYAKFQYTTRILILNPFSKQGELRGQILKINPVERVNIALFNFRNIILKHEKKPLMPEQILFSDKNQSNFLIEQLEDIVKSGEKYGIQIRFYNIFTEAPVYIISQFLAKGFMLYGRFAADSPWAVFVNDSTQDYDVYDTLSLNFDTVWNISPTKPKFDETEPSRRFSVFFSYSTKDRDQGRVICNMLKTSNIPVFFAERELKPGDQFDEEIRKALVDSQQLWVLVTPNSLNSEWVLTEWGAAWSLEKRIIPILFRCAPEQIPDRLRSRHCIDYSDVQKLVQELSKNQSGNFNA